MGITKALPNKPVLAIAYCSVFLISWSYSHEGVCLQDGKHKAVPSPEPHLSDCTLYSESSCCSENEIHELSGSPDGRLEDIFWDRCGPLSPGCGAFLRQLTCFRLCSPDAARWPHPQSRAVFQAVPLCHSFCRAWFEACKADLTCARNSVHDKDWQPQGHNCTGNCVTYQQMYEDGRALCEHVWGDSFVSVEDDEGEGRDGRSCGCLTLSPSDREVIAALRAQEENPDELDTTKAGLPQYRAPCRTATKPQQGKNTVLRKRSVFVEDVEGSGSGF